MVMMVNDFQSMGNFSLGIRGCICLGVIWVCLKIGDTHK